MKKSVMDNGKARRFVKSYILRHMSCWNDSILGYLSVHLSQSLHLMAFLSVVTWTRPVLAGDRSHLGRMKCGWMKILSWTYRTIDSGLAWRLYLDGAWVSRDAKFTVAIYRCLDAIKTQYLRPLSFVERYFYDTYLSLTPFFFSIP